uniref:MFS domain-containing protein n=1 Tax=Enterobius vermicularis TaxID=51028 RepID=A0A0N4VK47_ENTVE
LLFSVKIFIFRFLSSKVNSDHSRFVNESHSYELDGADAQQDAYLSVHSNKILEATEKLSCCQCQKRWQLAILANLGFLIVFGIRCNFGAAKSHMANNYTDPWGHKHRSEFNWTRGQLGFMESSFFYGYLITQIPAGFLAAKFAPNKLSSCKLHYFEFLSFLFANFKNATPIFSLIYHSNFALVSYPAMHGVWRYWAPPLERSKLATTAFTGSYAGAVLGLPISAFLVSYIGWSMPFYAYGIAGVVWAIFWFSLTFESPAFHPTISPAEKKYIEEKIGIVSTTNPTLSTIPWKAIMTSKPVYAIIVANFARSWTFYLLLQNQLTYMKERLGININESGFLAALPHAVMGIIVLLGGQLADYLRSHKIFSTTTVRKLFNCGGFGGEAFFLLIVAYTENKTTALIALVLAVGSSGFAISGFNVNHLDIAPRYAAILMGFSNGIGTLAGLTCPLVTEKITARGPHAWQEVFLLASLIHFTGVTFYAMFASGELQDWADPKDTEAEWLKGTNAKDQGINLKSFLFPFVLLLDKPFTSCFLKTNSCKSVTIVHEEDGRCYDKITIKSMNFYYCYLSNKYWLWDNG